MNRQQAFKNSQNPCPVCGGHDRLDRDSKDRCGGFLSDNGKYAHCTNSRYAGGLSRDTANTYPHYLAGQCRCGVTHVAPGIASVAANAPAVRTRKLVAAYDYTDEKGVVLYQALRLEPKGFTQRRPARPGETGEQVKSGWVYNLEGVRRVLYRLPEIMNAPEDATIYIVEGEKDVNRLFEAGLYATCNAMGAGKWIESYSQHLAGRDVVILPDNDTPGKQHARQVAESLQDLVTSLKVIELDGLPEKGDVSDWLNQGYTTAELTELAKAAPLYDPAKVEMIIDLAGGKWPNSPETEQAIINLLATYPEALHRLEEAGITDQFFYNSDAAYIFNLINRLVNDANGAQPKAFDIEQAISWLGPSGKARLDYYTKAVTGAASMAWLNRYINQLVDCYQKRLLVKLAEEIKIMALDIATPAEKGIATALTGAERVEQVTKPINVLHGEKLATAMTEYYQQAQCRKSGVAYGIPPIDKLTGGAHLGELTALSADRGSGKSALAQQACFYRAMNKLRPQLYITVNDMSAEQVFNRFMQQMTGVSAGKLAYGKFEDPNGFSQQRRIDGYIKKLPDMPLYVVEDNTLTSIGVLRLVKSMLRRPEIKELDVYVDYADQLNDEGQIFEKSSNISSNLLSCAHLKNGAGQPCVSMMVLHSLNKDGQIFGAKKNEHDAENIWAINNSRVKDKNLAPGDKSGPVEIYIEKQRHRISGLTVRVQWNAPMTRFEALEADREQEIELDPWSGRGEMGLAE